MSSVDAMIGTTGGLQGGPFAQGVGLITALLFPDSNPAGGHAPDCEIC